MALTFRNSNWTLAKVFEIIEKQNISELKILQNHKSIDFNTFDKDGFTILQICLFKCFKIKDFKLFRYLLKQNADPLIPDKTHNRDTIFWIISLNIVKELRFLLRFMNGQINFNVKENGGNTYLHRAVILGNVEVVILIAERMFKLNLDINRSNNDGLTPNMLAYYLGYLDITNVLEDRFNAIKCQFDELNFRTKTIILQEGLKTKKEERNKWIVDKRNYNKVFGLDLGNIKLPEIVCKEFEENKISIESDQSDSCRNWCYIFNKPVPFRDFSSAETGLSNYLPKYMKIYSKQKLPCCRKDKSYDNKSVEVYRNMSIRLYGEKLKRKPTRPNLRK